jgi:PAP2 superfamily protein
MKRIVASVFLALSVLFFADTVFAAEGLMLKLNRDASDLEGDYRNFYLSTGNLLELGGGLVGAGVIANTKADREIQSYYQRRLRGDGTDAAANVARVPGEIYVTVPALLAVHMLIPEDSAYRGVDAWAQKSLRALFLGGPLGLVLQRAIGAERPDKNDSRWRPFKSSHGLSGHAFIGAVPFIMAARMEDNIYLKGMFYGLSVLPGLSRINDNQHYFSQVALGWYLAYLSSSVVDRKTDGSVSFMAVPRDGGLELRFNAIF